MSNSPYVSWMDRLDLTNLNRPSLGIGIEHSYMLFPDEGHGFAKPENRLRFYAAVDEFFAKYM